MSPTQRTLKHLRDQGYTCWVVEYYNYFSKKRVDLFGIWDIIAIRKDETVVVQTTASSGVSARIKKISESEHIGMCRDAGWKCVVHGWRKNAAGKWVLREVDVS